MLSPLEQALLKVLIVTLMVGMGATLTVGDFREIARAPRGVLIGLASQFGWMPLIAFTLAKTLDLPNEIAIGLIVVGCTPGGSTSNLFTYFSRADVALSISMTATSTLAAVVAMPLLLWVYGQPFTTAELHIPYRDITMSLVGVLGAVGLGMFVRSRSLRAARHTERIGSLCGIAVLVFLIGISLYRNGNLLAETSPAMYAAGIGLGVLGLGLGYVGARAARLPEPSRRAVGFETGVQNTPLALGIIVTSFDESLHQAAMWLPLLYALFVLAVCTVVTIVLRRYG